MTATKERTSKAPVGPRRYAFAAGVPAGRAPFHVVLALGAIILFLGGGQYLLRRGVRPATPVEETTLGGHSAPAPTEPSTRSTTGADADTAGSTPVTTVSPTDKSASQKAEAEPPMLADMSMLEPEAAKRIGQLLAAIREHPADGDALGRLGIIYEAQGLTDLARRSYETAAKQSASPRWRYHAAVLAQEAGDTAAAEQDLRAVIAGLPDFAPAHERLARLLLGRSEYEESADLFGRVVNLRPKETAGYVGYAQTQLAVGELEHAAASLNRALTIDPACRIAHYTMGRVFQENGQPSEAAVAFSRGTGAEPIYLSDPWRDEVLAAVVGRRAMLLLAKRLKRQGRLEAATDRLTALHKRDPNDVDVVDELADVQGLRGRVDDAAELLTGAVKRGIASYRTHGRLALALVARGDLEGARRHADLAVAMNPQEPWVFLVKGRLAMTMGDNDEALDAFQRASTLPEAGSDVFVALGRTLARLQRWEEAAEALERAATLSPRSVTVWYNLGMTYAQMGSNDKAVSSLRTAQSLDPDSDRIRAALTRLEAEAQKP